MLRTVTDVERYHTMKDRIFDLSCYECAYQGVLFMAFLLCENRKLITEMLLCSRCASEEKQKEE